MTIEVYTALKQRLKTAFSMDYIDEYLEQYEDTANNPLWAAESWFIEFLPVGWESLGGGGQSGVLDFVIHHVTETGFDDDRRTIALSSSHTVKNNTLNNVLHGWSCTLAYIGMPYTTQLINTITRKNTEKSSRMRSLIVSKHRFQSTILDYSAINEYQEVFAEVFLKLFIAQNTNDNDDAESTILHITNET